MSIPNNELWVRNAYNSKVTFTSTSDFIQTPLTSSLVDGWTVFTFDAPLTRIGYKAFQSKNITEIIIPDSVTSIGGFAFENCTGLTSIVIPDSVTTIESYAFYQSALQKVELGTGLQEIQSNAFALISNLNRIISRSNVAPLITNQTFRNSGEFGDLYYPKGSDYSSWLSTEYCYLGDLRWNSYELLDIVIDENTGNINADRIEISGKTSITSDEQNITITVEYLDTEYGNADEYVLTPMIDCGWLILTSIKPYVFKCEQNDSSQSRTCNIKFSRDENGIVAVHNYKLTQDAKYDSMGLNGYDAVALFDMSSATLSYTTVSSFIGQGMKTENIVELNVNGITYPFADQYSQIPLLSPDCYVRYRFSDNYISSLDNLFKQNDNVIKVRLSDDIETIGVGAFNLCSNLTDFVFPKKLKTIGNSAFFRCPAITGELQLPNELEDIGLNAFESCTNITSVIIPDSVYTIHNRAFQDCTEIKNVSIGSGLSELGTYVFSNCQIEKITVSSKNQTFTSKNSNCVIEKLNNILYVGCMNTYIPDGVTQIAPGAFYGCKGLQNITIPGSVTLIANEAFAECENLYTITCYATKAPTIYSSTFANVKLYGTLYYPKNTNYSIWLSDQMFTLGWHGWNGVGADLGEYPMSPYIPIFELEYYSMKVPGPGIITTLEVITKNIKEIFVVHPYWITVTEKDGYFLIEVLENDGLPRTGEITFTAISNDNETIEQILTINQEGIEDMATSIALYKMRLDYPAEGGSKYVQVDYINASVINTPYCSQSWVTIEQTQAGTAIDGDNTIYQRQYRITMAPTSFARQVNVKFSCVSPSNAEVSTDKFMLYQAGPTVNPDDGEGETKVSPYLGRVKVKIDGTPEYSSGSNLGVGYENLTPGVPDVDSTWIHLGAGVEDTGVSLDDIVMRYPATYDENEGPERTGYITWRGYDANGVEYTGTTEVIQYGSDTPVDEGMIELQSLSVTLPAEGGSNTFVVKYYDAKTIYEPEFVGDWGVISEVGRSTENGVAFNGEECLVTTVTYKVTAQATDAGRVAKVILKADINYYDGSYVKMEKDKFRVYQMAPGSEEFKGIVYPFRNELTYDHKGYSTSWGSVRVGYKDVAIGTPILDSNWLSVKEIKDVTYSSKEYDKIYEYTFTLNENIASVSRTAIVTFIGDNEDGSKSSAKVSIVQSSYQSEIDTVATNYKGYFKSMDGTLYSVVFITDPNYDSYGEITLAGESPVTVSYTDSDRLYEPVRTSTCTIRVVTTQYLMNLYSGKAQGTQVILRNEDTGEIEWCGFLQPNMYNQGYCDEVETIEFEASDCLNTLQYLKYENYFSNGRMSVPFSYVISDMLDKAKLINSYYITNKFFADGTMSRSMNFNNFYISEYNFFSEEDEPWTLKEVLEEICKYFGYVCYQWGDAIYFIDYDKYASDGSMLGYKYEKSTHWRVSTYLDITTETNYITADSYKETGADMSLDDVFNKVSVNCNYYHIEDVIPDLFDDGLLTNRMEGDGYLSIRRYTGRGNTVLSNQTYYRLYDHKNVTNIYYTPLSEGSNHESLTQPTEAQMTSRDILEDFVGANIVDIIHLNYDEANGKVGDSKDWERYLLINQLNRPWAEGYGGQGAAGPRAWETYNFPIMEFKNLPTIFIDNTEKETGRPGMKIKPKNYLVINASALFTPILGQAFINESLPKGGKSNGKYTDDIYMDMVNEKPALCFYFEVPKKGWWNGSGWVDYKTWFEVPLEDISWTEKEFYNTEVNVVNIVETNLFLGSTGYKIPLPSEMDSTEFMYFAIGMPKRTAHLNDSYGADNTGTAGNAYCFIKDLKITIQNVYSTLYTEKDELIENVIDGDNVVEGDEISLKLTTDNGQGYSLSTVACKNTDDVLTTNFQVYAIDNELLTPEQAIIQKYVNQYSTPSIKENVTVDMSFKPYQLINDTWWNKNFIIVGQEIDYQYGKQRITLLEKK